MRSVSGSGKNPCLVQILLSEMTIPGTEVLIEKLLPKILGSLGKENTSFCTVQVRCDIISFGTISVRYIQLVKQKLMYAYRAAVSVVQYVYGFWNYLSEFLRQSGTLPSAA